MTPSSSALSGISFTPSKGSALHRQVFLVLRDEIARGNLASGAALPKEESLCEMFGVSRITVRRALADLAAQGLVERRHGLGTFVTQDLKSPRQRPTLSLIDGLQRSVVDTDVQVLSVQEAEPPTDVAELLQLPKGVKAVHALRLRSIKGTPVMLTDAWVPLHWGKRVTASALRKHALYEILLAQGVVFGRVVQEYTAVVADPKRATALKTEVGSPLLKLLRLMHGSDAQPVEHLTVYLCPDRSRILMDVSGADLNTLSAGQIVHDVG